MTILLSALGATDNIKRGYGSLMKILRQAFAEVTSLYQNDIRKATVITKP
jgi:hypothetical protein